MRLIASSLDMALEIADLTDEYSETEATVDEAFVVDCPDLCPAGRLAVHRYLGAGATTMSEEVRSPVGMENGSPCRT